MCTSRSRIRPRDSSSRQYAPGGVVAVQARGQPGERLHADGPRRRRGRALHVPPWPARPRRRGRVPARPARSTRLHGRQRRAQTRHDAEWLEQRPRLLRHEERHSWQYVACLGLPLIPAVRPRGGLVVPAGRRRRGAQPVRAGRRARRRRLPARQRARAPPGGPRSHGPLGGDAEGFVDGEDYSCRIARIELRISLICPSTPGLLEQAGHRAEQVPEQIPGAGHGDDVEHDPVEVDLEPEQVKVQRCQHQVRVSQVARPPRAAAEAAAAHPGRDGHHDALGEVADVTLPFAPRSASPFELADPTSSGADRLGAPWLECAGHRAAVAERADDARLELADSLFSTGALAARAAAAA